MTHYIEIEVSFSTKQSKMDQISDKIVELGLAFESQFRGNPDNPSAIAFKGSSETEIPETVDTELLALDLPKAAKLCRYETKFSPRCGWGRGPYAD